METQILTSILPLSEDVIRLVDSLYRKYRRNVFSVIYLKIKDVDISRDIMQDVFIKAARAIQSGNYEDRGVSEAWLVRIANNACIDYFRKRNKSPLVNGFGDLNHSDLPYSNRELDFSQKIVNIEISETLKILIDMLPDEQKRVVVMRTYLGMSYKEIAEQTQVSINTALGRMRYALINMRRFMREHNITLDGYEVAPDS